jgi:hypothetical protein
MSSTMAAFVGRRFRKVLHRHGRWFGDLVILDLVRALASVTGWSAAQRYLRIEVTLFAAHFRRGKARSYGEIG